MVDRVDKMESICDVVEGQFDLKKIQQDLTQFKFIFA